MRKRLGVFKKQRQKEDEKMLFVGERVLQQKMCRIFFEWKDLVTKHKVFQIQLHQKRRFFNKWHHIYSQVTLQDQLFINYFEEQQATRLPKHYFIKWKKWVNHRKKMRLARNFRRYKIFKQWQRITMKNVLWQKKKADAQEEIRSRLILL